MITVRREPLSFYVKKIERHQPFTSLLYGDGEFLVATRSRSGSRMAYGELVTSQMENEMLASFTPADENIFRGTDLNLIEWWDYGGNDHESVKQIGKRINTFLMQFSRRHWKLYDGVVWEWGARDGLLAPFLRALKGRDDFIALVGNKRLRSLPFLTPQEFIEVPDTNAYAVIDDLERQCLERRGRKSGIYVACCGLTAIPLLMRLRDAIPTGTFLDLGSTFDLFARFPSRGWRADLIRDKAKYDEVIRKNLEGV